MMRPTPRAVGLYAGGIPIAFLAIVHDPALWLVPVGCVVSALAAIATDAVLILRRARVAVGVTTPRTLAIGVTGHVAVALSLPVRARPTTFTLVLEEADGTEEPVAVRIQGIGCKVAAEVPIRSARRGVIKLEALWLRWRGPLGLIEHRWRRALDRTINVVPALRAARGAALATLLRDPRRGANAQRERGEGFEFETLRDHARGLDNRHIDWKRSARHAKLVSKVFATDRSQPIVLAFDTGHLMLEPIEGKTRLDHAIEAGLLLSWIALRNGDLVGAFAFDSRVRQYVAPAAGLRSFQRLQDAAASLAYATEETNFTLGLAALGQRLKRRALVVLFTDFDDTINAALLIESLARIVGKHVVIAATLKDPVLSRLRDATPVAFDAVARAVIAHDLLRERAIVLERVARLGVHVLDVVAPALPAALGAKVRDLKRKGAL